MLRLLILSLLQTRARSLMLQRYSFFFSLKIIKKNSKQNRYFFGVCALHLSNHCVEITTYIHEGGVDVVGALSVNGDEEGQAAVGRQHVHAAVLLVVPRQQSDAAVLHPQRRCHHV